jgi:hypothetical protein
MCTTRWYGGYTCGSQWDDTPFASSRLRKPFSVWLGQ